MMLNPGGGPFELEFDSVDVSVAKPCRGTRMARAGIFEGRVGRKPPLARRLLLRMAGATLEAARLTDMADSADE